VVAAAGRRAVTRRSLIGWSVAALAVVLLVASWPRARAWASGELPPPRETRSDSTRRPAFVGAERCAACHAQQFAAWSASTHGNAGGAPGPRTVIGRFDGTPIRFANADVIPRARRGTYEFEVRPRDDSAIVLRVDGVVGAGRMYGGGTQGYFTDRGDGSWRFLPFEWSRQRGAWFCNTNSRSGKGWALITPAMRLEECGDWPPVRVLGDHPRFGNCQSCHASQALVVLDSAVQGYQTRFTSLAINCESCHGPGETHVRLAESKSLDADVGYRALATLDKDASLDVCLQCHAVKDRLEPGFLSGDSLARFYSLRLPLLGDRPLFPDGRTRTFAYQEGHLYSDCYVSGGMTCTSCHDPHAQNYRTVAGDPLPGRFADGQCTSCHVSKRDEPARHTRHPPGTATCVSCHMPARQQPETEALAAGGARAVPYARSDHTIGIPRPTVDSALGVGSACATCHVDMPLARQVAQMRAWWGEPKPLPPAVAGQLSGDSAAPSLFGASAPASARMPMAQFAALARFLEQRVAVDTPLPEDEAAQLERLTRSPDVDVRAIALATLHLAHGDAAGTRRLLARALRDEGPHDAALRARWATILGYMGDRFASVGAMGSAITAYERAIAVQPANARLHLGLAEAKRGSGDLAGAVASYQASIARDARAPLAWVNLGIALGDAGDTRGATEAFVRATQLDAAEPLAWFNLGNLMLVQGDLARAREFYVRSATLDASIPLTHFQLARVSLLAADSASALRYLRRGLALDSTDASAREQSAILAGAGSRRGK